MKQKQLVAVTLLLFLMSACSRNFQTPDENVNTYFPKEHQVNNHTDGSISQFGLNIASATEMGDWVVSWVTDLPIGEGFQYYVYSDPDSWDVYICYPPMQAKIPKLRNDDISVDFSDGVLKVYVSEDIEKEDMSENINDCVLHFAAPLRGTWPGSVKLFWNDVEVKCDGVNFDH